MCRPPPTFRRRRRSSNFPFLGTFELSRARGQPIGVTEKSSRKKKGKGEREASEEERRRRGGKMKGKNGKREDRGSLVSILSLWDHALFNLKTLTAFTTA